MSLRILNTVFVAAALLATGCGRDAEDGHDHAAHQDEPIGAGVDDDHDDEHGDHEEGDDHDEGHDEADGGHEGHDDEGEGGHDEDVVRLSPEQLAQAGVVLAPLSGGTIVSHITLPGEVGLNLDSVLHVTPRVAGIASQVGSYLGDKVEAGQVLAVLDSPQLGQTKIELLQALQAQTVADADLARQVTISASTEALLKLLSSDPDLDTLQEEAHDLRVGLNKGRLVSAYARMKAAAANHAREKELGDKGLVTQADLLAAQEAHNSTRAEFFATLEEIDFTYRVDLQKAEQAAHTAASGVENARRRLHLLGMTDEQIESIRSEAEHDIARYELRSSISGRVVDKHITPGEKVGAEQSIYTIADLSTVWLNIAVYAKYIGQIEEGQTVVVHADGREATGTVSYVSATLSEQTRTVTARVVLENADGQWKPGEFVTVRLDTDTARAERSVPLEAIQTFEGRQVIFIQDADGIEPVAVIIGRRNDVSVELLGDEPPLGTPVVVANSFLIKAELGKGAAGHDH